MHLHSLFSDAMFNVHLTLFVIFSCSTRDLDENQNTILQDLENQDTGLQDTENSYTSLQDSQNFEVVEEKVISILPVLTVGQWWKDWDSALLEIDLYAQSKGFAVKKQHVRKQDNQIVYRTLYCTHGGVYKPNKKDGNQRNKPSRKVGCKFCVHLHLTEAGVELLTVNNEHNHSLSPDTAIFHPKYRRLSPDMKEHIQLYTEAGNLNARVQRQLLKAMNINKTVLSRDVHNEVQKVKKQKRQIEGDASALIKILQHDKECDPGMVLDWDVNEHNELTRVMWMSSNQVILWLKYHDVVVCDTTSATNRWKMPLLLLVVVDDHNRTRIACQAIMCNETSSSFKWVLQQIKNKVQCAPHVVLSDADPSIDLAFREIFPDTIHQHCLFHLRLNINKHLAGALGEHYQEWLSDFYLARNAFQERLFEQHWNGMQEKWHHHLQRYPKATKYITKTLYSTRKLWAAAFTKHHFTAGLQSTSRVEGCNALVKKFVNSSCTLVEFISGFQDFLEEEKQRVRYEKWVEMLPEALKDSLAAGVFKEIDCVLARFLTPPILKMQRFFINRSFYYIVEKVDDITSIANEVSYIYMILLRKPFC